jgi:type IV pilus assembly protein PilZ
VPKEKRKFERAPMQAVVVVEVEGEDAQVGQAVDISVGGMFVDGVVAPFGARVTLRMRLPGDDAAVVVSGVVRWVRDSGVGVQFGLLGARETHAITNVVGASERHASGTFATDVELDLDLDDLGESA